MDNQDIINLYHQIVRQQSALLDQFQICLNLGYKQQELYDEIAKGLAVVNTRIDNANKKYPWLKKYYDNFFYEDVNN